MLRLLVYVVIPFAVDDRSCSKIAFARIARRVDPGGDVAVFIFGTLSPRIDGSILLLRDAAPPRETSSTGGLQIADALRPIARICTGATVLVADDFRTTEGEDRRIDVAAAPMSTTIGVHPRSG